MAALGIVAKLGRNGAHQVTHKVDAVIAVGGEVAVVHVSPARRLAGHGILADQIGPPDHVCGLVGRHEDGIVKVKLASGSLDLLLEGVQLLHACIGHVGDDVWVQLFEGLLVAHADGGDLGLGVQNQNLAGDVVLLDVPGNQAGALVGRRRAAVGWWWQGHHQGATLEVLDLVLERQHLLIGDVGVGEVAACVVDGLLVVAKPGFVVVADTAGQD